MSLRSARAHPALLRQEESHHKAGRRRGRRTAQTAARNAVDQERSVAARLMGKPKPYNELAWFLGAIRAILSKLTIAGLAHGVSTWVVRGDRERGRFPTFGFRGANLRSWNWSIRPVITPPRSASSAQRKR